MKYKNLASVISVMEHLTDLIDIKSKAELIEVLKDATKFAEEYLTD